MGDLALEWDPATATADLALRDDDLASEDGLRTAMLLSLFLDRREDDQELDDRRGWWGDEFLRDEGDRYGSRLWRLDRSKLTSDLVPLAEEYDREALAWLVEDRVVERLDVEITIEAWGLLHRITAHRPTGRDPVTFRFSHVWDGEAARAV